MICDPEFGEDVEAAGAGGDALVVVERGPPAGDDAEGPASASASRPPALAEARRRAPIVAADGWIPSGGNLRMNTVLWPHERLRLADAFADAGASEHASIAACARMILHLLAVAAPASLIADTRAALADKVEHARRCFAVASALAGHPLGPGPLALDGVLDGPTDLSSLAVAALRDGCVGKTIAAAIAQAAAEACEVAAIREHVAAIADDGVRHADLAWRTLAWALEAGGAEVREALAEVLGDLGDASPAPGPEAEEDARGGCPRGHGFITAGERQVIAGELLREVIVPRARALIYGHLDG